MFMTKTRLRIATDHYKDILIDRLLKEGLLKMEDGRQLYELTLSELEKEWRVIKERKRSGGLI